MYRTRYAKATTGLNTLQNVRFQGGTSGNLYPILDSFYTLGTSTRAWLAGYFTTIVAGTMSVVNFVATNLTVTNLTSTTSNIGTAIGVSLDLSTTLAAVSVNATNLTGTSSSLGTATATSIAATNLLTSTSTLGTANSTSLGSSTVYVTNNSNDWPLRVTDTAGGAGNKVAIALSTYDPLSNPPTSAVEAEDVGAFESKLKLMTKIPGAIGNALATRLEVAEAAVTVNPPLSCASTVSCVRVVQSQALTSSVTAAATTISSASFTALALVVPTAPFTAVLVANSFRTLWVGTYVLNLTFDFDTGSAAVDYFDLEVITTSLATQADLQYVNWSLVGSAPSRRYNYTLVFDNPGVASEWYVRVRKVTSNVTNFSVVRGRVALISAST